MKQLWVAVAATALLVGACGTGDGDVDVTGDSDSAASFCEIFETEGESILGADVLAEDLDADQLDDVIAEMVDAAPEEIEDDMVLVGEVTSALATAVDSVDPDDPAALEVMIEVMLAFEDRADEIEAAGDNVQRWVNENCDVPEDFGEDSSDGLLNSDDANTRGDDAGLDALWDDCAGGDMASCDSLYLQSPIDSDYETFGSTCGETSDDTYGNCVGGGAVVGDGASTYGDDAVLDAFWDSCAAGDDEACDELWWSSPIDSEYEEFATYCGLREDEPQLGECAA